ncbi:MAG: NfeD family protein [Candidatus Limnocylindria bacterium]
MLPGRSTTARRVLASVCLGLGLVGLAAPAVAQGEYVAHLQLRGVIDQVNAAFVEEALTTAAESGAVAAVIQIDSPGGELTSMDRIITAILNSRVPVITWVAPEGAGAGSAATFITLAGDVAAMAPNTNIGAASVVGSGGADLPETLAKKITNDSVSKIRALAESHGRNADWAEDAVRDAASVNAADALAMEPPVVDIGAANVEELLAAVDVGERTDGYRFIFDGEPLPALANLPVEPLNMNAAQQFLHLLSDPNVAFILFTIGFYGIVAELFHPNFLSGIVGAIALLLAFIGSNSLPLNVGGLLLLLLGAGLLALEVVVTSYGLLTVGGVISFLLGAFALYTDVNPQEEAISVEVSPVLIGLVLAAAVVFLFFIARGLLQVRRMRSPTDPMLALVGASGTAQTTIAPTGIAYAGGEAWSARSREATITPGTPVRVVGVDGLELIVEPSGTPEPSTAPRPTAGPTPAEQGKGA